MALQTQVSNGPSVHKMGVLVPLTVCSIDKTNIFFTLSMKNVLFILDILFSVTMVTHDALLMKILLFS